MKVTIKLLRKEHPAWNWEAFKILGNYKYVGNYLHKDDTCYEKFVCRHVVVFAMPFSPRTLRWYVKEFKNNVPYEEWVKRERQAEYSAKKLAAVKESMKRYRERYASI